MGKPIDPFSYGIGFEHGRESNMKVVRDTAHDLALIEDKMRAWANVDAPTIETIIAINEILGT